MPPWLHRALSRFKTTKHSTSSSLPIFFLTPRPLATYTCSLCHTASRAQHPCPPPAHNTPNYIPLLREIEQRREEARRSILVQVMPDEDQTFQINLRFLRIGERIFVCTRPWFLLSRSLWPCRGTSLSHKSIRFKWTFAIMILGWFLLSKVWNFKFGMLPNCCHLLM